MTPADFDDCLDRLGGDLTRWPPETRDQAQALLAASASARESLAAMAAVEEHLTAARREVSLTAARREVSLTAARREVSLIAARREVSRHRGSSGDAIAAWATRHRQAKRARIQAGWAAAAAAALAIGIMIGSTMAPRDDDGTFALATASGPAESGYVD